MNESLRAVEAELYALLGKLKHSHYIPTAGIEGLTPAEGGVLMAVVRSIDFEGAAPRAGRIGHIMHLSPSALSQLLKSLEEKCFIVRERDANDSRAVSIKLTEEGTRMGELGRARFRANIDALEAYLGEDDLRELVRILGKIDAFFQEQVESGQMMEDPHRCGMHDHGCAAHHGPRAATADPHAAAHHGPRAATDDPHAVATDGPHAVATDDPRATAPHEAHSGFGEEGKAAQ